MERVGRLSDAGPREGRAGSPMPSKSKILAASEAEGEIDDDEDEEESPIKKNKPDVFGNWSGWRSDDAAFGPSSMVKGIRAVSTPGTFPASAVISDEDEDGLDQQNLGTSVRQFFRRASEHIPTPTSVGLRRPSTTSPNPQSNGRALSPKNACPPALDSTPALALGSSIARVELDYSGGLAHRLEQSLAS
jgi:hypothetical protein